MSQAHDCDLILALDLPTRESALAALDQVGDTLSWVKIGLQLFTAYGPEFVHQVADRGYHIFLDLKLHDIPNTVAKAVESIAQLPVDLLSLHASGGAEMLQWAGEAAENAPGRLRLLAVTVLTSMNEAQLRAINVASSPQAQVLKLAALSRDAGIGGLVCSPLELVSLREMLGPAPTIVTPGIRPAGSDSNEQKRIMTPATAARAGASFIVVGRPILRAEDPAAATRSIQAELTSA
jgi:orotidine-5'-phosphate decarboxylase